MSGGYYGRCGELVIADSLCRPSEVPTSGVGFSAARHPRHRAGIPARGVRAAQQVPTRNIQGGKIPDPWESSHRYDSQSGWDCSPRTYLDRWHQLDSILCHQKTPRCDAPRNR